MLQKLTAVAPRDNDALTLRRGQALAQVLLLLIVIVAGLAATSLVDRDRPGQFTSAIGMTIFVLAYVVNRSGRVQLAVRIMLIAGTLSTIAGALITQRPLPMLYFLGSIVVVAAAFGRPLTPILWAAALSFIPFVLNLGVYGTLLAPTAPIPLPDGTSLPSVLMQEIDALALLWMLSGTAYLSSHLLNQLLEESRAATEQALASNQALRQSEARFSKVFHAGPAAISITRFADACFIDANESFEKLTGYGREELLGRTAEDLRIWADPAERRHVVETLQRCGSAHDLEATFQMKSGELRTILVSVELIELDGESCLLSMIYDITERTRAEAALRDSEEQYRLIAEHSRDLIALLDHEGRMLYASPSHQHVLGYAPIELIGRAVIGFIHPDDRDPALREWSKLAAESHIQTTVRARHAKGEWLWIEVNSSTLDQQGNSLNVARDITERKRLEAQLLHAQKMETVGRLAGGIAHDFNNLLTAITGYADLALEELPATNAAHADIKELRRAADRATSLTRQLLAFARKQRIEPRIVDLNQLIHDMREFIGRLIGEDIELTTLPATDLGSIQADTSQIEQVIVNLVVNARDAMPQGGRLAIETANVVLDPQHWAGQIDIAAGHYVLLTITDTGVGMDATVKEHLFEPFFTTKAPGKGTGLGLATCYGIVKQHGGYIFPYSELGHGTMMKVYLPRVDAPAEPLPEAITPANPRGNEIILLAEDEPAVRDLAARVLRGQGYTVLEASDGVEALRVAEQAHDSHIDLLLTDVVMPQLSGGALAEQLSAMRPGIKVLFVSGYSEDAIRLGSQLATGAQFLHKPFSPAGLAQKVRTILDT